MEVRNTDIEVYKAAIECLGRMHLHTLDDVLETNEIVIVDASVLISSADVNKPERDTSLEEKREYYFHMYRSAKLFRDAFLSSPRLCTIPEVCREYWTDETDNGGQKKKGVVRAGNSGNRDLMKLRRAMRKRDSERKRLVETIYGEGRILSVDRLHPDYIYIKNRFGRILHRNGLSHVDKNLFYSAVLLSQSGFETALLSNDKHIEESWSKLFREERGIPGKFNFYFRDTFNGFRLAY